MLLYDIYNKIDTLANMYGFYNAFDVEMFNLL